MRSPLLARRAISAAYRSLSSSAADPSAASVECVVIGAGVVGLACARALAEAGREVVIVETANHWGTETSSRHSEVIHAGLYYPPGSHKAQLCVDGNRMLYEYCRHQSIPHRRITKLVVATTPSEVPALKAVYERANKCGVANLEWLSGQEAMALEPQLNAAAAFLSPNTGILDSHTYMAALLADAESAGASLTVASRVTGGHVASTSGRGAVPVSMAANTARAATGPTGVVLSVKDRQTGETTQLHARHVVNAAGLWAQDVSSRIRGIPSASIPKQYLARGVYFTLNTGVPITSLPGSDASGQGTGVASSSGSSTQTSEGPGNGVQGSLPFESKKRLQRLSALPGAQPLDPLPRRPFSRLIYPIPQEGGLGIHLTLDLQGGVRFGPDVEWIDKLDYKVDPKRGDSFYEAIRTYWPHLPDGALQPGYSGIRPKISGPGMPAADFVIQGCRGPGGHGVEGLVCLYGIESPGLTSSLAIAERVRDLLLGVREHA